jgi:hypothetical protein
MQSIESYKEWFDSRVNAESGKLADLVGRDLRLAIDDSTYLLLCEQRLKVAVAVAVGQSVYDLPAQHVEPALPSRQMFDHSQGKEIFSPRVFLSEDVDTNHSSLEMLYDRVDNPMLTCQDCRPCWQQ